MLKGFTTILVKELKELMRDPKILIGMIVLPLIMFPVLGLVFGYAVTALRSKPKKPLFLSLTTTAVTGANTSLDYLNTRH